MLEWQQTESYCIGKCNQLLHKFQKLRIECSFAVQMSMTSHHNTRRELTPQLGTSDATELQELCALIMTAKPRTMTEVKNFMMQVLDC